MVFWTKVQDVEDIQAQQMIQCLDTLPKETVNDFANIKKPRSFVKKLKMT